MRSALDRCLVFAWLLLVAASLYAADVPPLRGRVNDYARLLPAGGSRELEARLEKFEQETGHQVAVLTIPTLDGEDIEGFSIRVAETWKIGQKGFDNGVILVVVPNDKQLRLEVGYGLEGVLPDVIASRIIRDIIIPRFRELDYAGGILAGTDAVLKVIRGEPTPESARKRGGNEFSGSMATVLILLFILSMILAAGPLGSSRRKKGMWVTRGGRSHPFGWRGGFGGGGFGGGGGGGFSGGGGGFGGGGASGRW